MTDRWWQRGRRAGARRAPGRPARGLATPLLLVLFLLPLQEALHRVTRVIDGDTIEVEIEGRRERVRYIGIDTPEPRDPREAVRTLARRATAANARLVRDRRVRLEFDVERRDRYGRLLAYAWVGDTLVNERLLREGFARVFTYPPNVKYAERFLAAERAEGKGAWGEDVPASRAGRYVGERATVCGRVVEARYVPGIRGRPTFLNFGARYPDQPFTAVIWGRVRARFERPPEEAFEGRIVCVEGTIERYRGTPQIVVEDPARIAVRRPEPGG